MKTFSELAECVARIPPKITLYGLLFKYNYVGCLLLLIFSIDLLFAIRRDAFIFKETGWFCRFPKISEASEARQVGDGWRKAANMLAQTSHWNRVRKPAHCNSVKQKCKQCKSGKKKRNKRQIYGLLVNARDVCHWTKQFKSRWKKGRQERSGDWGFDEIMSGFCLPGRYSLVFIDEGHQLGNFFSINAGAIEWSTLKISTCYSADSGSRPPFISASNFPISYLFLLRFLTSCYIIF